LVAQTLIFLHIPKTAGTTLHQVVDRQVPRDQTWAFDETHGFADFQALGEARKAEIRLFKGHMIFGLHERLPGPATYFTLLRDPIERVISEYHFARTTPTHHLYARIHAEGLSLRRVFELGIEPMMENAQTRMLSGGWYTAQFGECSREALDAAIDNLENHFAVVGLTERFDETLLLLKAAFGWRNVFYVRRNVAPARPRQSDLSPATLERVRQHNLLDLALYDYAVERFERQMQQAGPGFRQRVEVFQTANAFLTWPVYLYWRMRRVSVRAAVRSWTPWAAGHRP